LFSLRAPRDSEPRFPDTSSHWATVSAFWLYGRDVLNDKYCLDVRPSKLVTVEDEMVRVEEGMCAYQGTVRWRRYPYPRGPTVSVAGITGIDTAISGNV
jgi:hypothetical protein